MKFEDIKKGDRVRLTREFEVIDVLDNGAIQVDHLTYHYFPDEEWDVELVERPTVGHIVGLVVRDNRGAIRVATPNGYVNTATGDVWEEEGVSKDVFAKYVEEGTIIYNPEENK